ncbi:MAG: class I tRNA ligase family protein, partial [Synergistaceae bacterium]|nr:class I tRNA ligase family protein [Synergistaceae bacterium]
ESYRRIRNTARFLLANLNGFNPARDTVPHAELGEIDRYILLKLARLIEDVTSSFDAYEFHLPMFKIHQFCDNELSAFYIDISKDTLYADGSDSRMRRCARSVMWEVLSPLVSMIAPILCFTSEEIWAEMRKMDPTLPESVHMSLWPSVSRDGLPEEIESRWDKVMEARGAIQRALESARSKGVIGHSLDASVRAVWSERYEDAASVPDELWETVVIVSDFERADAPKAADVIYEDSLTGITVGVSKNTNAKCPRCWKHRPEIGGKGGKNVCDRCADVLAHLGK